MLFKLNSEIQNHRWSCQLLWWQHNNFGRPLHWAKTNIITKLKDRMKRDISGVACSVHNKQRCIQTSCDMSPTKVETLVVK
jgi:hypothetical protein